MKTAFAALSVSVKHKDFEDLLNYMKVRHDKYTFGITDDLFMYVEGEINDAEEKMLIKDLALTGARVYSISTSQRNIK